MRTLTWFFAIFAAGCAASSTPGAPVASTVRERLAAPTRLLVTADRSTGSITARRYTGGGWQSGTTRLAIADGELDASVAGDGALAVTALAVSPAPIEIPASVFGQPAQLRDIRLTLAGQPAFATTWTDDDDANATATIDLDLAWSLEVGSTVAPLATQHLHAIPIDIALVGNGEEIDATIGAHADGELWSWADLLELDGLELALTAATD